MKKNLMILIVLTTVTQVSAEDKLVCSLYHAYLYKDEVRKLENDKQMHCSMSCLIARKCDNLEVVAIGFIKEFIDALGYGTPDPDDIKANLKGIDFAKRASTKNQCYSYCKKVYPKQ